MLPHWKEGYVTANGGRFHYVRTGEGSGRPVVVLAHGFSDNGLCWLPVARDLEDTYDVILPDARGHGLSERVAPGERIDNAADLAGIIQALGLERPVAGGHSMGAAAAAELGARFPGVARALVLEDPPWRFLMPPPIPQNVEKKQTPPNPWNDWLQRAHQATTEQIIAKGRADNPTWPDVEWQPWAESKQQLDLNITQIVRDNKDWHDVARALDLPVLLVTADPEKGAIVTPEEAQEAARLAPAMRVVKIEGAGHNIRRENYPDYLRAVRDFLTEVYKA